MLTHGHFRVVLHPFSPVLAAKRQRPLGPEFPEKAQKPLRYSRAFGVFLCLLAFAVEATIGAPWIHGASQQWGKKVVVTACCIVWAILARAWAYKLKYFIEELLDIFLGALLGFLVVALVIDLLNQPIGELVGQEYAGWEDFATLTIGIPVALTVAFHSRGWSKLLFVLAFGIMGSLLFVHSTAVLYSCDHAHNPFAGSLVVVAVAAVGALVQWYWN
ncbi:unnamed protein product [Effrenium voratum]|nr:unnamed protein product [Effrenium voratum]